MTDEITCPFCGDRAIAKPVVYEGFPETLTRIFCKSCNPYTLPTRLLGPDARFDYKDLDLQAITLANRSAMSEGKMMIWIDRAKERLQWEQVLEVLCEERMGFDAFAVRDIQSMEST